jgi:hypothetical protein
MDKTTTPPSGDKHDYISLATYWWPDPMNPTGPYIRLDGQSNPARLTNAFDEVALNTMAAVVTSLGLGYFFTDDEKYAERARLLLTTWFIDPATRMNPNLNFGQGVPGTSDGRKEGVIDTIDLARMLDAVELLRDSRAWTPSDNDAFSSWLSSMLDWLRTNTIAKQEEAATNNHGTWYDVQVGRYALFLGRMDVLGQIISVAAQRRITVQINPDGTQPLELARTKAFDYSLFNLRALFDLATLASEAGTDLFGWQSADGRSIRKALDFMTPYVDPTKPWPYPQITDYSRDDFVPLLRRAGIRYASPAYETLLDTYYSALLPADHVQLLNPR